MAVPQWFLKIVASPNTQEELSFDGDFFSGSDERYPLIDGVVSFLPDKQGPYMTGGPDAWPEVNSATPWIMAGDAAIAEFSEPLSNLINGLGRSDPIVSVCDGGGYPSGILASTFGVNVISLDISLDPLRYLTPKTMEYYKVEHDLYVRVNASALKMPLRSASVSAVIGMAAIHHLQLLHSFFREAYRVLKPGGFVWFANERSWSLIEPNDDAEEDITRTRRQYRVALEAGGFLPFPIGLGKGYVKTVARKMRLPFGLCWKLRHLIPFTEMFLGKGTSVTVAGRKPA
jgi:SAM-dependent methyltransferase